MEQVLSVRPTGKFPEKVEILKRWSRFPGWNFRTECLVPFTFLVVCTSSRSTVGHRHVPGFTTKWNNFLPIGNSTFATTEISGFFPKWKAPDVSLDLTKMRLQISDIHNWRMSELWKHCWTFFNPASTTARYSQIILSVIYHTLSNFSS